MRTFFGQENDTVFLPNVFASRHVLQKKKGAKCASKTLHGAEDLDTF